MSFGDFTKNLLRDIGSSVADPTGGLSFGGGFDDGIGFFASPEAEIRIGEPFGLPPGFSFGTPFELASSAKPPVAEPVGFFDNVLDVFKDVAIGAGRTLARGITPDPIEAAIQVFFPDIGAQVFGSPLGFPAPSVVPPSFPAVISEAGAVPGATPPFFPQVLPERTFIPAGTIGTLEDVFPTGTPSGDMLRLPSNDPIFNIPANINDPDFGVARDQPGIFDDLGRAAVDIFPELIPEVFGGGVGGAIAGGIADVLVDRATGTPGTDQQIFDEFGDDSGGLSSIRRPPMAEMTIEQWASSGRPSGFCLTTRGTVTRRRHRRKRPLSQQAKDDLAWAKATFGAGKQFDSVVSRMRF